MIPGAFISTLLRNLEGITPFPSIGRPKASTTRPSNSFPTGTSTIKLVRLTMSPSFINLALLVLKEWL